MDTLILGAGTMGQWVGTHDLGAITFADHDEAALAKATEAVDGAATDPTLSGSYDLVCVAVPMSAAPAAIEQITQVEPAAVVDVTGEMQSACRALNEHHETAQRGSFHPLFAPANAPGNVAAVIESGGEYIDRFVSALETAGNTVFETTAGEHDRAMETIQAAAHTAVLAYGLAAESVPEHFETPVSRELETLREQVTSGDPAVYAEIQEHFDGADRVAAAATDIAAADTDTFESLYTAAGEY